MHEPQEQGMSVSSDRRRPPQAAHRDPRRAGFTLVELLMTVAIVGILAGLALPNLRTAILRSRAAAVAGDMDVVRVAAITFNADNHSWPTETPLGNIPTGLDTYLPDNFTFDREGYRLDYENWSLPSGLPGDPGTRTLIGVSVNTDDDRLGNALIEFMGGSIVFSVGNNHTIVIDRS